MVDLIGFLDLARDRVDGVVEAALLRSRPQDKPVRPPYVLLTLPPPDRAGERFCGTSSLRDVILASEVGATSMEHALYLSGQLDSALLDWRPDLAGAWFSPLTYYSRPRLIEPPATDLPGVPLWSVSTLWECRAEPDETTQEWMP